MHFKEWDLLSSSDFGIACLRNLNDLAQVSIDIFKNFQFSDLTLRNRKKNKQKIDSE